MYDLSNGTLVNILIIINLITENNIFAVTWSVKCDVIKIKELGFKICFVNC